MSIENAEKRQNEAVAIGAVYMTLTMGRAVRTAYIEDDAIVVEFDFLASPYRIRVEQITDD